MRLVGKCPPTPDELAAARDRGFDAVELYVETGHVDRFPETLAAVREAAVDVVSVHTPHVRPDDVVYFEKADELAAATDATLVVHSQYLHHTHIDELESIGFDAAYGYENIPGASRYHVTNAILDRGHDLILDTAHLFMAEPEFGTAFEGLLERYDSRIPVVHLNDATLWEDGLAFGHGDMDLRATVEALDAHYTGDVVLEVMPAQQADALRQTRAWLADLDADVGA
ncbi:sugar phosphate isomerase/epimerase family protein [Salinigranum sp. GCM10025319]|uniref:sugar phosphate isomerase/epimerase family protein n=1 Tax=Salinigranum sp. GCM10025319 TaxID=3252687 RepID=UPI003610E50D